VCVCVCVYVLDRTIDAGSERFLDDRMRIDQGSVNRAACWPMMMMMMRMINTIYLWW
jgi:hypothetical protein